jgi:hypothetical protein
MALPGEQYMIFDGDKVGDLLAKIFLSNRDDLLAEFDAQLRDRMRRAEKLLRQRGVTMIAAGADGITCKGVAFDPADCFAAVNSITTPYTFSMGLGNCLMEAFVALRFAKASGRSRWARWSADGVLCLGDGD